MWIINIYFLNAPYSCFVYIFSYLLLRRNQRSQGYIYKKINNEKKIHNNIVRSSHFNYNVIWIPWSHEALCNRTVRKNYHALFNALVFLNALVHIFDANRIFFLYYIVFQNDLIFCTIFDIVFQRSKELINQKRKFDTNRERSNTIMAAILK